MKPITLCDKEVSGVCHISDVGIWNNRHAEYANVFKTLYKSLKTKRDSVIVITGKLVKSPNENAMELAEDFLRSLAKISSVILTDQKCLLPTISNVHHITDRGVYEYGNIAFVYRKAKVTEAYDYVFGLDTVGPYDYVLASGLRKKEGNVMAPGSLIQQSWDTPCGSHGYQYYDLGTESVSHVKIRNPYGFCELAIKDGILVNTDIPEKATLRYVLDNTTYEQYLPIAREIAATHEIIASTVTTRLDTAELDFDLNTMLSEYLSPDLLDLHKHISSKTMSVKTQSHKWRILKLEFDNTISYGKGNVIDFTSYAPNTVIGIVAPNRYGKSAIMDIILYCLFEKLSRGNKNEIINASRDSFSCALTFESNGNTYYVKRTGTLTETLKTKVTLLKNGINISGSSKTETNKRIESIIGNYHDYMATYFHMSTEKGQFIDMSSAQKKEYMFDLLNISSIQKCHEIAKAKLKKYQTLLKSMVLQPNLLADRKRKILEIDAEIAKLKHLSDHEIIVFDLPEREHYPDLRKYGLTSSNIYSVMQGLQDKIDSYDARQRNECHAKLMSKQAKLDKIKANIKPLRDEYDTLFSQLVAIPTDYDGEQLEYLKGCDLDTHAIERDISAIKITPIRLEDITRKRQRLAQLDSLLLDSIHNIDNLSAEQAIVLSREIKWLCKLATKLTGKPKHICEEHINDLSMQIKAASNTINRTKISQEISSLRQSVISHYLDKLIAYENEILENRLTTLKTNLETAKRRDYLLKYEPKVANNERIKARLAEIKPHLNTEELEEQIKELSISLARLDKEHDHLDVMRNHLKQMEAYERHLVHYELKKEWHIKWSAIKRQRDAILCKRDATIARLQMQRETYEKEILAHIELKNEHTKLSAKVNTYQCYVNATHPNGIQYEIIKKYLPMIQSQVNHLLQCLTDFTIAFNYEKAELSMSIVTQHKVNAQMACGYEKFIITSALMIVLGRIASQCKPNFMVIDEGWSKVDADNRCKIEHTMSFIKSQCDHVILISHDTNMIAKPDYSISIVRKKEMSYIQSSEPL